MKPTLSNHSTFLDLSYNNIESKHASLKHAGDNDFMAWMSNLNPALLSKYPTLSRDAQSKLKSLYSHSQHADGCIGEVLNIMQKCEREYEALAEKTFHQLQLLGVDAEEDLSCEIQKCLQESSGIICQGKVGDGTDAGAASALATDFLNQTNFARQKFSLMKNIKLVQKRNARLKDNLQFLEKECKSSSDEVSIIRAGLEVSTMDLNVTQDKQSKLDRTVALLKTELIDQGVTPAIYYQTILDTYNKYNSLRDEIKLLEGKFQKYGELPPSVNQASSVLQSTKDRLELVSNDLRKQLSQAFGKRS